jgi:hypothetical protein
MGITCEQVDANGWLHVNVDGNTVQVETWKSETIDGQPLPAGSWYRVGDGKTITYGLVDCGKGFDAWTAQGLEDSGAPVPCESLYGAVQTLARGHFATLPDPAAE